ncbi:hypothetical protein ACFE04_009691 [Oxalis oulophora]
MGQVEKHENIILSTTLLVVNLVVYFIVLGLEGWSVDKYINGEQNHPHLGGNAATTFVLESGLRSAVTGVCSVFSRGVMYHRGAMRSHRLAVVASLSSSTISLAVTTLAFGFVCKQIMLGGHRGKHLKTLEFFIIISLLSQVLYLVLGYAGMYNSSYQNRTTDDASIVTIHEHQKTGNPTHAGET